MRNLESIGEGNLESPHNNTEKESKNNNEKAISRITKILGLVAAVSASAACSEKTVDNPQQEALKAFSANNKPEATQRGSEEEAQFKQQVREEMARTWNVNGIEQANGRVVGSVDSEYTDALFDDTTPREEEAPNTVGSVPQETVKIARDAQERQEAYLKMEVVNRVRGNIKNPSQRLRFDQAVDVMVREIEATMGQLEQQSISYAVYVQKMKDISKRYQAEGQQLLDLEKVGANS
jgi:hypothetical protein